VVSWLTDGAYRLAITLTSPLDLRRLDFDRALRRGTGAPDDKLVFENVWRVRIASFVPPPSDGGAPSPVVSLLDVVTEQRFARTGTGSFEYRCVLTADETAALAPYCSVSAAPLHGTSIWFEDAGGHVSAPEEVQWFPAMPPALFVTQSLPILAVMISGRTYGVSVTMRNTGVETWTAAAGVKLGSQSPQDNTTWGISRVALPGPVAPGETVTFSFTVTAPSVTQTTTASFQWRMVKEFVEWFGEFTPHVAVQIVSLKEAVRVAAYYIGQKRGRGPGDWVSVETPEGSVRARARLNDTLKPNVVCGQHGWWQACAEIGAPGYDPFGPDGANFNLIIGNGAIDPISGSVPHRAYLCQIRRAD